MKILSLIFCMCFGFSYAVKVNIDQTYDNFEVYAKDKRQSGNQDNIQQRQLVYIPHSLNRNEAVNKCSYLYGNKYPQEDPIENVHAPTRRIIEHQSNSNINRHSTKNSNVFLPIEHRQESENLQRLIPEEQLLKLIEDELAARGFPLASRPFPTPNHLQQTSGQNIALEIANKAREILPAYQTQSGNFVPILSPNYGYQNIDHNSGKLESKANNVNKASKVEESKYNNHFNQNPNQKLQQTNIQSTPLPSFLGHYNYLPFAQLNGYSTTPKSVKAAFTATLPKQLNIENRLLKSTAPQTFIGFNNNNNNNNNENGAGPVAHPTPRNNPYFSSQQYINPYIENFQKKAPVSKKDSIINPTVIQRQEYQQNDEQQLSPTKVPSNSHPEEFQALVDAGYPVTAVPVPVPYDEYIKQQQRLIEIPLKPKQQVKLTQSRLQNVLEPVHIQQQKQQEHNGGTI
uniref:Zasp-like motif domain-containing protein n=1 Tax=Megaselia scalaris TaxID=36166 RepID=T1GB31_MEGSC